MLPTPYNVLSDKVPERMVLLMMTIAPESNNRDVKDEGSGVTTDSSGNIYVTGYTNGDLDGKINTNFENGDIILVKYDSSGIKKWTKLLGTSEFELGEGVTTDSSDNIYVTGTTYGDLDGNTSSGVSDIFLVKYNSSGTQQ